MPAIKLTYNDINEMVHRAVRAIMNESVKEAQGSIMADKENVIQEIVDYITDRWEQIKENGEKPARSDTYRYDNKKGVTFTGALNYYIVLIPQRIVKKLGIAQVFDMNVAIQDYEVSEENERYILGAERATEGSSYGAAEYNEFVRAEMKVRKARIDLYVPSINGELQTQGLYSTIYHELNHTASRLQIQSKHQDVDDEELKNLNFFSASRRKVDPPHYTTYNAMHPADDPVSDMLRVILGDTEDTKLQELKKNVSFIFYSLWETTERNAKAEAIYGELQALGATRANFRAIYPKTELYRQIEELKDELNKFERIETPGKIWLFVGKVMGMSRRGKNDTVSYPALKRYCEAAKNRFLDRSSELLDILYKKSMKVAELYFQRHEPQPEKSRLGQYKERKKSEEEVRKAQNLLQAIFGNPKQIKVKTERL